MVSSLKNEILDSDSDSEVLYSGPAQVQLQEKKRSTKANSKSKRDPDQKTKKQLKEEKMAADKAQQDLWDTIPFEAKLN